jgi:YD repeat-containing protein
MVVNDSGSPTVQTRYEHDAQGQLMATSLPDGSVVRYVRNGQGQVVALQRSQVGTQWLKRFESAQVLLSEMERDAVGLKRYTAGNGVKAEFIRSREGALARVVYRAPAKGKGAKDMRAANEAGPLVMGFLPGGVVETLTPVSGKAGESGEAAADAKDLAYYLHDEMGRRILAKQMYNAQDNNTRDVKFEEGTSRWVSDGEVKASVGPATAPP